MKNKFHNTYTNCIRNRREIINFYEKLGFIPSPGIYESDTIFIGVNDEGIITPYANRPEELSYLRVFTMEDALYTKNYPKEMYVNNRGNYTKISIIGEITLYNIKYYAAKNNELLSNINSPTEMLLPDYILFSDVININKFPIIIPYYHAIQIYLDSTEILLNLLSTHWKTDLKNGMDVKLTEFIFIEIIESGNKEIIEVLLKFLRKIGGN